MVVRFTTTTNAPGKQLLRLQFCFRCKSGPGKEGSDGFRFLFPPKKPSSVCGGPRHTHSVYHRGQLNNTHSTCEVTVLLTIQKSRKNYHQHQNVCNTKKSLRGINFVKLTKNIFQSTRLPEERMGVTKKIGGRNEFP